MDSIKCSKELDNFINLDIFLDFEPSINIIRYNFLEPAEYCSKIDELMFYLSAILSENRLGYKQIQSQIDRIEIPSLKDYSALKSKKEVIEFENGPPTIIPIYVERIDVVVSKYNKLCKLVEDLKSTKLINNELFKIPYKHVHNSAHKSLTLIQEVVELLKYYIPNMTTTLLVDILHNNNFQIEWKGSIDSLKYLLKINKRISDNLSKNYGVVLRNKVFHNSKPYKLPTNSNYKTSTATGDKVKIDEIINKLIKIIDDYQ